MADARHIEKHRFGTNCMVEDCLIFTKICTKMQDPRVKTDKCENFQNFEVQDGGRPPSWKSLYRIVSVKMSPDFYEILYALDYIIVQYLKFCDENSKLLHSWWRTRVSFFSHSAEAYCQILYLDAKSDNHEISSWRVKWQQKCQTLKKFTSWRTTAILKIALSLYFSEK